MTATEQVILVDENDKEVGMAEKLAAHRLNLRHRAFSVFVLRQRDEIEVLLQQRADCKYHSPGLWTNTCCSHPRPGEDILVAGQRRLLEEMGLKVSLKSLGWFHYIAEFPNGLVENEIDYVLIGFSNDPVKANLAEVKDYQWLPVSTLINDIALNPAKFTPWLAMAFEKVKEYLKENSHALGCIST